MRSFRKIMIGAARSGIWPAYLGLVAYAVRQAPVPKTLAQPAAAILAMVALAYLASNLLRRIFGPGGWAEEVLAMPAEASRMAGRALVALVVAHLLFLGPVWLLTQGMIAPGGRPVSAPAVVRGLILGFEAIVLVIVIWSLHWHSPLVAWLTRAETRMSRLGRHQRKISALAIAGVASVMVLDARGYSFSAHRLSTGAVGSIGVAIVCWLVDRLMNRFVDDHAWRWIRVGKALSRRGDLEESAMPDDLAARLKHLSAFFACGLGLLLAAWVWDIDMALFRFLGKQELWATGTAGGKPVFVTLGELTQGIVIVALCAAAWRHMSTFFAVVIFPRMSDDPGVRFAAVTLCRYAVIGIGLFGALSSIHLGLEKIGVVLAALGVGLGFGLQEIVSNFVCGIILLLERPIRVGDIVTVGGQTGKVDRINIRATTIINGDNQSMIMPNRAFITGELINWTLKDKIIRVTARVKVAYGTDPDRVAELLLSIAQNDPDVLRNPVPSALLEEISDSALVFALSAHVPEPGLAGRVRHRLYGQIQQKFKDSNFSIALPIQELFVKPVESPGPLPYPARAVQYRVDNPSQIPPAPRSNAFRPDRELVEDGHRGVDE